MGEGLTGDQCSHRWKTLCDKFVRELKKTKPKSGDPGPPRVSSWPLFQVMSFLSDTVKHKKCVIMACMLCSNVSSFHAVLSVISHLLMMMICQA